MNSKISLIVLVTIALFLQVSHQKPLRNSKIVYAIDIGNQTPYESKEGVQYQADKYFDKTSRQVDYSGDPSFNNIPIKFTEDAVLYQTERHSDTSFIYKLPFKQQQDGFYVLVLRFCELYFQEANKRKTNIKIGSKVVLENVDIVEKVGSFSALDEFVEFEFRNGKVFFNDSEISNGINRKGELVIEFEKTEFDLPKVDALLVIQGNLQDSYQKEYNQMKSDWYERILDEERVKDQERKKRETARKILQEEFSAELDTEAHLGFIQGISLLLFEPIGIIIIVLLVLFFVLLNLIEEPQKIQNKKSSKILDGKKKQ